MGYVLRLRKLLLILASITVASIIYYYLSVTHAHIYAAQAVLWWSEKDDISNLAPNPHPIDDPHPIVKLAHDADIRYKHLVGKETRNLADAAHAYRRKRGRHPPPGFDKWYQYAVENNAVIIEELWDQIYHDLHPFWALDQKEMLGDVRAQEHVISIRKGRVEVPPQSEHFWVAIWSEMVGSISEHLPDLDMAVNHMDEPRLLIPWEDMNGYVENSNAKKTAAPVEDVKSYYSGIQKHGEPNAWDNSRWNGTWPLFERARLSCPPDSAARSAALEHNFDHSPVLSTKYMLPHLHQGYISNYSLSTSICDQPDLQSLHGIFVEPISIKTHDKLFPLFGGSKLTVNSDILFPGAMYYKPNTRFSTIAPTRPWSKKTDTLVWRGIASGGRNKEDNWRAFHRHRLVSMLNGTQALQYPSNSTFIDIQDLPLDLWELPYWNDTSKPRNEIMGEWLNSFTSVAFTSLVCFPWVEKNDGCAYTDFLFSHNNPIDLASQHKHKYLVDVDGNSFSGRYRDFLLSGSLPIKATLFQEWHDSRLVPWKHFVPFDNRYLDLYGIMEFFLGWYGGKGRDVMAHRIAKEGQEWAKKVLRKEDMRIYTYRLLLEYARVMDVERDILGFVGDLMKTRSGAEG